VLVLVLGTVALGPAALAQSAPPDDSPTTIPRGAVTIGDGFAFTAGVVNPLPSGPTRTMNAYQTAVFVQSWLADAFFGHPTAQDPPPTAPVFRVDVTGLWGDSTGTLAIYYASDGTTAWISFPQDQSPASAPPTPPPATNWFVGAPAVIPAFQGTGKLVTTTTSTIENAGISIRSSDLVAPKASDHRIYWFAIAAVLVVLAAVSVARERMRRRRKDDEATAVRVSV